MMLGIDAYVTSCKHSFTLEYGIVSAMHVLSLVEYKRAETASRVLKICKDK